MSTTNQQPEQRLNHVYGEVAILLDSQESIKAEAFSRLPGAIEKWADVIRENRHVLDELHELARAAHVQIPAGYGLVPNLDHPFIGTTCVEIYQSDDEGLAIQQGLPQG